MTRRTWEPTGSEPVQLGEWTWTELRDRRPLLVVPVGSCEQHGPHLPLDTDTRIAEALARKLVAAGTPGDVVLAPSLTVTASGEHAGFPGTLSLGNDVMEQVLVELVRSADWSSGVVLVNGHGGNATAVTRAVATLRAEQRRVLSWWPRVAGGDAHAGRTETALLLAIDPALVRLDHAEAGPTVPVTELFDSMRAGGVRAVSPNGVLGDPSGADAGEGLVLFERLVADLVAAVDAWRA